MKAHEPTGKRINDIQNREYEDDIGGGRWKYDSMSHFHLVHTPILVLDAMKIPKAKAAVDKK